MAHRSALIAVPSYSPYIHWEVTNAISAAVPSLASMGIRASAFYHCGEADLCRARNVIMAAAHVGGFTDLVCVDADVSWKPGTLERLLSHPVDMVFGAYPLKADGAGFAVRGFPGQETAVTCIDALTGEPKDDGIVEVEGGPAGFMRVTKACMDRMIDAYDDRWYNESWSPTGKAWSLFEFTVRDHRRRGEDIEFCHLWREIGGKVWVDPWLTLTHHGQKSWTGTLGDKIKALPK